MEAPAAKRGAVVLRVDGELCFVPASVALRIAPPPRVTAVPGSPPEVVGVALHEGAIVPVVAIGDARGEMVVCQHAGELLGLVGAEVLGTGAFEVVPEHPTMIRVGAQAVRPLDIAGVYARVESGARAGRWVGS
jgi:hypothetical protein